MPADVEKDRLPAVKGVAIALVVEYDRLLPTPLLLKGDEAEAEQTPFAFPLALFLLCALALLLKSLRRAF